MFTKAESFLYEKFETMPMWVRVFTYLILLLVLVYGYVAPKYIDGIAYIKLDEQSKEQYLKSAPYSIMKDGRAIKLTTSEEGLMSIPLSSIFHTSPIEVHVFPNGYAGYPHKVEIPVSNVLAGKFTITYTEESDLIDVAAADFGMPAFDMSDFDLIGSAVADDDVEMDTVTEIKQYVQQAVANIAKKEVAEIRSDTLITELGINKARVSYLHAQLEDHFKVVIWSEIWSEAVTVQDLVKILYIATNKGSTSVTKQTPVAEKMIIPPYEITTPSIAPPDSPIEAISVDREAPAPVENVATSEASTGEAAVMAGAEGDSSAATVAVSNVVPVKSSIEKKTLKIIKPSVFKFWQGNKLPESMDVWGQSKN